MPTRDGAMETFIVRPERGGPYPAVLMLMDAPGIREELHDMARRLATAGFCVLLPNLYYRAGRDTKFGPGVLVMGDPERDRMRAIRTKMTIPPVMGDVADMIAYLDRTGIAAPGPIGVHGYCMSGPLRARRRRALSRPRRRRGIVLRHLAGQRGGGKPAPDVRPGPRRAVHRLRRT